MAPPAIARRLGALVLGAACFASGAALADPNCWAICLPTGDDAVSATQQDNCLRTCNSRNSGGGVTTVPSPIPPCMIAQNAMRPCTSGVTSVDARTVGTWTTTVNGGRWVWEIERNGAYRFHSEASDGAPSHGGAFSAKDGHWTLQATSGLAGWSDGGSYAFQGPGVFSATGKLGSAVWRRVAIAKR